MGEVGYKTLAIDIETFSDVDLIKCGVYAYADSPAFEILLFAYSFDDEETKIIDLAQGEQLTEEIKNALSDVGIIKTAFNANFERTCLSKYMGVRLSPESWVCTAVQSAMLALPLSLEGVGAVLGLSEQKLKEGKDLIRYFCVPCKPTKTNGGRSRNLPFHAPEKWKQFKTYCMYWPSTSADGEFFFRDIPGTFLNPDSVLERYADWRDSSSWPVSSRQKAVVSREMKKQADPLSKEGIVGAFCRTYSIEEAIRIFLPDVYQESMMPERFDYIPADSQAGVVIYEGKFAYSHHATDPACGKLLNAFDIVRIHKFGEQDDKAEEGTDSGKLPSFKAMSDFAVSDEQVKITLAKEREKAASEEFDVDTGEWQTMLDLDRQGKVKDTLSNIATIIRFDENLQPIVFNQLKNALDVIGELPWVQVKKGWGDADIACAKLYFERVYGIWSPTKFKDALLAVVSSERLYHPVKEYFSTLSWDGCSRIDSLLIDYMGAENTPYVRAVTRKTLVAAVARIYEPGIKFDSVLVLNGPQGCGKSTFFAKLGKEWYSDSLTISDMKDGKTAAEKLQGYWLLELGELAGIKKVDVETVKSFVTRTDDKYRQSYGTTVESHPRECVIVGSTNSEGGFLRDVTGNRRFWPVHVTGKGKHRGWDLTPETVDQIWAEAISIYKDGEELYLKGKEAAEAYVAQQEAMESDEREGIVEDYLERLLPADWDTMDLYQRRSYLGGGEFEAEGRTGTVVRERFCLMEVWCECFGKERQNFRKTDSYELESIIQKIGGWKKYEGNSSGKMRIPGYGVQRVFVRVKKETAGNK